MSKVKFDGEEDSIELNRITAKKNWMSPEQCNKMGSTYMFDALHKYMGDEMYPDLHNEVEGHVAVKQLPVYTFEKILVEGTTDQYNHKYIGNFTVGADKGDKNWFGFTNDLVKDTAFRLEGTDHIKGVGFNYPWEVNGVKTIRYNADKEALCIVTGSDKTAWSAILEQSYVGNKETESEIETYLEQEFKPAFDCAYRANPLLVGVTTTLDEINADIDGFKALRRSSDDRQYSYCEFWIDGEYDLYYLNLERNRYEKNGVNLYDELSDEEKALVDAAETLEEKNQVFINFRINRFKEEAPNYWHINDGLFQLSFLYNIAAKDNGEKNMYPYKLTPLSEGGRWRFFQDDLDSIKAKDNQGLDTAKYSVELHDFTDDKKNAYVFKGEDNAYFQALEMAYSERLQKMGKDMLQAMYDISPKGTKTLDKLMGFFDEFFFSRAQDYFTKSAYNNDAEFYEEAWNDKEYVASVDIHPLAQSTGDHYTADRAWFEKRMLYLMAKYGFGSYSNYEDSSLGIISVRTQVAQGFTLTPAIDSFPTILGGQAQISKADHRIKAGESIKLAAVGGGNTNTYIVGADWLSDIGDLKDLSIDPSSVVVLSVASKRLRRLKVGDENAEEVTSYLATLSVQQCDSMETVDARNLTTLVGTVDLSKCPRLLEALFGGTNVTGVIIAAGSKVEHIQLPDSITTLDLRNTKFLDNFEYGTLANLGFVRLENVPNIDAFAVLKEAYNTDGSQLKDIRLVGWTYNGDATDLDMIANLATDKDKDGNDHSYNGIDAEGVPTTGNPVLEGALNVDGYVYEDTANIVKQYYPTIQFTPKGYYVRFADPEVQRIVATNWGDGTGITQEQVEAVTDIGTVFKGNTVIETFDEFEKFTGVNNLGIANVNVYESFSNCTSLRTIKIPKSVTMINAASFYNCKSLTHVEGLDNVESIGQAFAECTALSQNIIMPKLTTMILGRCFSNCPITGFSAPKLTSLPDGLQSSGVNYGVFHNCTNLKDVDLDWENMTMIGRNAFNGCTSLEFEELNLPNLETLGQNAFYGVNIKKISNLGKITALPTGDSNSQNFGKKDVLEEVVLPDTLTSIPAYSLYGYLKLNYIISNAITPPTLGNTNAISNTNNCPIYVPDASVEAYKTATNWVTYADRIMSMFYYLGYIDFADPNVLQVLLNAGYDTDSDGKISMEEAAAVTDIGSLFQSNYKITSFDEFKYFTGVTSIARTFSNTSSLKTITFPSSLTTFSGYHGFSGSGIKRLTIPKNVTNTGSEFFKNCTRLETVVIETESSIKGDMFADCPSLRQITINADNTTYSSKNNCLYNKAGTTLIIGTANIQDLILDDITKIESHACCNMVFAGTLTIPENITHIGENNANLMTGKIIIEGAATVSMKYAKIKTLLCKNKCDFSQWGSFGNTANLTTIILEGTSLNKGGGGMFDSSAVKSGKGYIYVPDSLVDSYKTATNWSTYAAQIKPINVADTLPDISTVAENDLYKIGDVYWKAELVDEVLTWVEI